MKVICIGGAPSSGTTLLADLLDAVPGILCGPELNIFCIKEAYRFSSEFKSRAAETQPFDTEAAYAPRSTFFNRRHLDQCGLSEAELTRMINESATIKHFVDRLANHCAASRDRYLNVFAEKTPINVSTAEDFCSHYPDGLFIHMVRDGRAVVSSLMRRGFPIYAAAFAWMAQTMAGQQAASRFDNVMELAFEDLLADPFECVTHIARRMGIEVGKSEVQQRFAANDFRKSLPRLASWSAPTYSGGIRQPAPYDEYLSTEEVALLESLALVRLQPNGKATPIKRFAEVLTEYQYPLTKTKRRLNPSESWQQAYRTCYENESHAFKLRHERRKLIVDPGCCKWFVPSGIATKDWLRDLRHVRWPTRLKSFLINHPLVMAQVMMMSSIELAAQENGKTNTAASEQTATRD
jgi:hypothetical protein